MDFLAIIVIAVAVTLVYWFWIRPSKTAATIAEEPAAPYKVETPVAPVEVAPVVAPSTWPAATETVEIKVEVAPVVAEVKPELKVISSQPKQARAPRPRAKKPTTQAGVQKPAAQPKKPRQPKQ
jgi:hypothetical protein